MSGTRPPVPIRLRGHTLLCLQGFRGEGYSPEFTENLAAIARSLALNPDQLVQVVEEPDAVCGACPHQAQSGCTLNGRESETEMRAQDHVVLTRLGLQAGTVVRWGDVLACIRSAVRGSDLPGICGSCRWLPLGYCAEGIDDLRNEEAVSRPPTAAADGRSLF